MNKGSEGIRTNPTFEVSKIRDPVLASKYNTQLGTVKGGEVVPDNEPTLMKTFNVKCTTTTGNDVEAMDLVSEGECAGDDEYNGYFVVVHTNLRTDSDAITTDAVELRLYSPATTYQRVSVTTPNERKYLNGGQRLDVNKLVEDRFLMVDFSAWAGGETHSAHLTVEVWKYPKGSYKTLPDGLS